MVPEAGAQSDLRPKIVGRRLGKVAHTDPDAGSPGPLLFSEVIAVNVTVEHAEPGDGDRDIYEGLIRVRANDDVHTFVRLHGGSLYVWTVEHRSWRSTITLVETATIVLADVYPLAIALSV